MRLETREIAALSWTRRGRQRLPESERSRPSSSWRRAGLAVEIWATYARVRGAVHRRPLPELIDELAQAPDRRLESAPADLSAAVDRRLTFGRRKPTCLVSALVLFRLLRRRGQAAELVIGLREHAVTQEAHAWVELEGRDVGPAPGRNGHVQLARFG